MTWLPRFLRKKPKVAVVRLEGTIAAAMSFGASLNDSNTSKAIEKAFSVRNVSAVVLLINSPGGSPVQSSLIASRVSRLAKKNKIKVLAFCEDVAASKEDIGWHVLQMKFMLIKTQSSVLLVLFPVALDFMS